MFMLLWRPYYVPVLKDEVLILQYLFYIILIYGNVLFMFVDCIYC